MKAVRYHSYGDRDVLVYEEADRPVAGAGQVVVQVVVGQGVEQQAAGVLDVAGQDAADEG